MYRELESQAVLANGHDNLIEMDVFSPTYQDSSYGYVTLKCLHDANCWHRRQSVILKKIIAIRKHLEQTYSFLCLIFFKISLNNLSYWLVETNW